MSNPMKNTRLSTNFTLSNNKKRVDGTFRKSEPPNGHTSQRHSFTNQEEDVEVIQVPMDLSYTTKELLHPSFTTVQKKMQKRSPLPPLRLRRPIITTPTPPKTNDLYGKPSSDSVIMPKDYMICELCDHNFPSAKVFSEHMWKVHKTQRRPNAGIPPPKQPFIQRPPTKSSPQRIIVIPDIEISSFNPRPSLRRPNSSQTNPNKSHHDYPKGGIIQSLADAIIYHPPASSSRRRTSNSSGSGSSSSTSSFNNYTKNAPSFSAQDLSSAEGDLETELSSTALSIKAYKILNQSKTYHPPIENRSHWCSLCGKVLSSRAALQGHLRIHTGEKPFNCKTCNRFFSNSQTLSRHLRTHTGEKPYECPVCGKSSSLRHNMKLHIKTHEKQMILEQNYN